jgi:hypothetical protein
MISLKVFKDYPHIKEYLEYMQDVNSESIEKIKHRDCWIYFKNGDMTACVPSNWHYKGMGLQVTSIEYFYPVDEEMHKYLCTRLRLPFEAHRTFTW